MIATAAPFEDDRHPMRNATRGLVLPRREVQRPKYPERRAACARDLNLFAMTYFSDIYWDPNEFHIEFALELQRLILSNTVQQQAIAAPRGIGKTTEVLIALIWAAVHRHRMFMALFALKATLSNDRLGTIKDAIHHNEKLFEDFPEICGPVRDFEGDPKRAPPEYPWSVDEIRLPNGVWFVACGIDGSFLGLNKNALRPDFCLIDDPENSDTVKSPGVTLSIERRIRDEICALETLGERTAYLLLTTIRRKGCIGDRFTDPRQEPEWRGRRYRALISPPENAELWEQFKDMCRRPDQPFTWNADEVAAAIGMERSKFDELSPGYRAALAFYAANKTAMDAGARVLDPIRLPLHSCYHKIATKGESVFASEYQNDPSEDKNKRDQQLNVDFLMRRRLPAIPQGRAPIWADLLIVNIDVGMYRLHWQVDVWSRRNDVSALIDQGIEDTGVDQGGRFQMTADRDTRRSMIEEAILSALGRIRLRCAAGWAKDSGEMIMPYVGVDAGGQAEEQAWFRAVIDFCHSSGSDWHAMRGAKWTDEHLKRAEGNNWLFNDKIGFYEANADHYKRELVRALELPMFDDTGTQFYGTRYLHDKTPLGYCKHLTAEKYFENFESGAASDKALKSGWVKVHQQNHWFDTSWGSRALYEIVRRNLGVMAAAAKGPKWQIPGADREEQEEESGIGGGDPLMQ